MEKDSKEWVEHCERKLKDANDFVTHWEMELANARRAYWDKHKDEENRELTRKESDEFLERVLGIKQKEE